MVKQKATMQNRTQIMRGIGSGNSAISGVAVLLILAKMFATPITRPAYFVSKKCVTAKKIRAYEIEILPLVKRTAHGIMPINSYSEHTIMKM